MISDEDVERIAQRVLEKLFKMGSEHGPLMHQLNTLEKVSDDILMYHRMGEVAMIDKVRLFGPPSQYQPNPNSQGAGNMVTSYSYTFIPKDIDLGEKYPLIVLPHGGVHANFNSGYHHFIKELITQGYLVIAPEYRGSMGYGKQFYELIDYGGLEVEDTFAARNWMINNVELVDAERVGLLGWSHGGLHVLFNIFNHPEAYQAAHASVPVSDLIARMGYKTQNYRDLYEAEYHIGESAFDNIEEYKKRSPAWRVPRYDPDNHPPLLVHSTMNDQDVNVTEVEHLIKTLKDQGWKFEYRIYPETPGGHMFSRLDTQFSKGVRGEIYRFLSKHLNPPGENPLEEYIGFPNPLE
jgi:dipeptidyl aminopeptidase/acylaminoacyl peptidase